MGNYIFIDILQIRLISESLIIIETCYPFRLYYAVSVSSDL